MKKKIFQVRKGYDGKWYPREMTGNCKWWKVGFSTKAEAEKAVVDPDCDCEYEFEK